MQYIFKLPFFIVFLIAESIVLVYLTMGIRLLVIGRSESNHTKFRSGIKAVILALLALPMVWIFYTWFIKWIFSTSPL